MSRTLFWYVFKDLLRIFFMASGAIAAIMSFGGLLRPLTQNGLGSEQVLKLLGYFMPAMSTYSLPVAALFATTVVYGRMAADNEQTACRASGISFLSMAAPAMLLGLLVSIGSMYMLCFTVPNCTAKIEQTIKSNLARLVAHQIDQTHETKLDRDKVTVFAQSADLVPQDEAHPNRQAVVLHGPLIVSAYVPPGKPSWFHVPKEFWTARTAVVYIRENPEDGSAMLTATLRDGIVFPRRFTNPKARQGGTGAAQFGPIQLPSRLSQKTKFMNIFQLKQLEKDPTRGQEVKQVTADFIKEDQANAFCTSLANELNAPGNQCVLRAGEDTYTISAWGAAVIVRGNTIVVTAATGGKLPRFRQVSSGQIRLNAQGRSIHLTADADTLDDQIYVTVNVKDALVDAGDTPSPQADFSRRFVVPTSPRIAAIKNRTAGQYLYSNVRPEKDRQRLLFAWVDLVNHIRSEMHARAAFVVSCLLLVLVGAALGMMFKSGNFLTAFAVSVIPALFSTVLIVTGQHTAESTPQIVTLANNPLTAGIALIWAGNVVIGIVAVTLLWRLQRH